MDRSSHPLRLARWIRRASRVRTLAWLWTFSLALPSAAAAGFDCRPLAAAVGRGPFASVAGDFDGDGRLDLAASYVESGTLAIFLQRTPRHFELVAEHHVGQVPRGIAADDVNRDGHTDLAVGSASSFDVVLLLGDGAGGFAPQKPMRGFHAPFHVLLDDLDGDTQADLLVVNECNWADDQRPGRLGLLHGNGDGTFRPWLEPVVGISPSYVLLLDVDGRHGKDLLVANWRSSDLSVVLRAADGSFGGERRMVIPGAGPIYGLAALDYDGDGRLDVAATDLAGKVHLLRGGGDGFTFDRSLAAAGTGTRDVDAADVDGDGQVDLLTVDQKTNNISWLQGQRAGGFAPAVALPVGLRPRTLTPVDLDADGKLDLVVANQGEASLSILYGSVNPGVPCASPGANEAKVR